MKPETRNILLKAYAELHKIIEDLYEASDKALENNDFDDATLLSSRADKLYEEVENLEIIILELE
jgi:cob(I)alamin adenosyltransferase